MNKIIAQTGGIGDLILLLDTIDKIEQKVGECSIFTNHEDVFRYYTGRNSFSFDSLKELTDKSPEYLFMLNTFSQVLIAPKDDELYQINKDFIKKYNLEHYLRVHPFKDGISSELMLERGYKRHTLPQAMLGFEEGYVLKRPENSFTWFDNYITIHDGVSTMHEGKLSRATKTWDINFWNELCDLIRENYPDKKIIQLGSSTSRKIKNADYRFLDSFPIKQTFDILANSQLHIDGDSGLVHAARSFGVKSIVMFGPTPASYFGYDENINIQGSCSPCWWKTDTWLKQCVRNYKVPMCMNDIYPSDIFEHVKGIL